MGNIFSGTEGILVVTGYGTYAIYRGRDLKPGPTRSAGGELTLHFANLIAAVRARSASEG